MTDLEILEGLGEIVEEIAGVPAAEVTPGKNFVDDIYIDSLSMVEIAVAAQDKFGVEIPNDQLKHLRTVQDVVTYVGQARGGNGLPGAGGGGAGADARVRRASPAGVARWGAASPGRPARSG